jgi:hypothetical protein
MKMMKKKFEPMIDFKYPTIASGATPIGSAGRAPDKKLFREERERKFRVHGLNIYSHRENRFKNPKISGSQRIEVENGRSEGFQEVEV